MCWVLFKEVFQYISYIVKGKKESVEFRINVIYLYLMNVYDCTLCNTFSILTCRYSVRKIKNSLACALDLPGMFSK